MDMWKKLIGSDVPAEVAGRDTNISEWFDIYRAKAPWLDYHFVSIARTYNTRRRLTMNPAKIVCSEISTLIWSEDPVITTDDGSQKILDDNKFNENMAKYTEYGAALGGFAVKIHGDGDELGLDFVTADCFIPLSWDNVRVYEAAFLDYRTVKSKSYVRVETHKRGSDVPIVELDDDGEEVEGIFNGYVIESKLYEVKNGHYTEADMTLVFPEIDPINYLEVEDPPFVYIVPPTANNIDMSSPMGISMFANAIDTIQALDMAFDGLNSEIVLGKKRIIIPANAVKVVFSTDSTVPKRYFDPHDEVYQAFSTDGKEDAKIIDNSVELRITEIKEAIQVLLDILSLQVGYSPGYLTFDGAQVKTATEVISDNSKTFKTKQAYQNNIAAGIEQLIHSIQEIEGGSTTDVTVKFADGVIEDRNSKTAYWVSKVAAGLATTAQAIMALDGLDDAAAKARVEEIRAEKATMGTIDFV